MDSADLQNSAQQFRGKPVITVGIDAVEVARFSHVLKRRPALADRLFSAAEIAYCEAASGKIREQRFAVRFAAKEAVLKALGVGLGSAKFVDIEVIKRESGQPEIRLSGKALSLASKRGISSWLLSLSHSDTVAVALVAAV